MSQSSFLSVNDKRLHFGLGAETSATLDVRWPNGVQQTFPECPRKSPGCHPRRRRHRGHAEASVHGMTIRRRNFLTSAAALPWLRPNAYAQAPDAQALDAPTAARRLHHRKISRSNCRHSRGMAREPARVPGSVAERRISSALSAAAESRIVRPGPALEVRRVTFPNSQLSAATLSPELRSSLSAFSTIHTAEFQVTRIDAQPDGVLRTRVRYELVGSGPGFHREQRVGWWDLEWAAAPPDQYRLRRWQVCEETRARSAKPWFEDIAPKRLRPLPLPTASKCCAASMIGARFSTAPAASISTATMACRWATSMATASTTFTFASPPAFPTGFIAIAATERSRTSPRLPASACSKIRPARFSPTFRNAGRQDLIVVRAAGPLLFLNQGGGKFRLKPNAFQFANPPQGTFTGAAAADYDRDGWLDIYFCLYAYYQGADQYKYPTPYYAAENGPPNFMLRNNRDGTFRDVTAQSRSQPEQHAL